MLNFKGEEETEQVNKNSVTKMRRAMFIQLSD